MHVPRSSGASLFNGSGSKFEDNSTELFNYSIIFSCLLLGLMKAVLTCN